MGIILYSEKVLRAGWVTFSANFSFTLESYHFFDFFQPPFLAAVEKVI